MKKAPPVRLSLRKLFIAMLAVGPISILPSPLLAAIPASAPFTAQSGSATWNGAGNTGTINASNRAVLNWGTVTQADTTLTSNFVIAAGETFNFVLPSGGAVLNRVTGNNSTTGAALINGTLLSNGQVVILANGDITVGTGAQISTASGLVLSTLQEDNFNFTANGNLALTGTSQGSIILGTGTGVASFIGNVTAAAGAITLNNLTVSGDLVLNRTAGALTLTGGAAAPTTVGGNLTVTTNNSAITQGAGALIAANGNTTLTSGTGAITLATVTNDFKTLSINTTSATGDVSINDANSIAFGASTLGGDLTVTAVGADDVSAITTTGAVVIGGAASFTSTTENSAIVIGNNSSVTGTLAITTNNSNITFNGVGNLTTGAIASGQATNFADPTVDNQAAISITTNGVLNVGSTITNLGGNAVANITLTGASITQTGAVSSGNGAVTLNATAGNITTGAITANQVTLNASTGSINPTGTQAGVITTTTTGTSVARASGAIYLNGANAFLAGHVIQVPAGSSAVIANGPTITLGTTNVTGNVTLNSTAGDVVFSTGTGTGGQNITVGGVLAATGANITDGDYGAFNVAGGLNLTATGNVVLDAAVANGGLAPNVQFGQVRISAGDNVTVSERTTLNLGNITADNLTATSVAGDIINTGDLNIGAGAGTANFTTTGAGTTMVNNGTNSLGTVNFVGVGGTAGSGGSITVGSGGVTLGSATNVTAGDDVTLTSTNAGNIRLGGATIGGSLIVNSAGTITTVAGTNATLAGQSNTTVGGSLFLTAADSSANSITMGDNGRFVVAGNTTIASSGNVTLEEANEFTGGVIFNQTSSLGNASVWDLTNLTISGATGGALSARAGGGDASIDAAWGVVVGNITAGSLTINASNGGGGNSGTITQATGSSLHVEGAFTAVTNNGNIVLTNNGNSAGRVAFFTNGGTNNGTATISYTEDGTIRVGNVASNSNITLRSNFGSIIEDTNANTVLNVRATLNATAPNGNIQLGNTTQTTFSTTGNVANFVASAPNGSVAIQSNSNITLGAINANSLIVTAVNNITQSAALNVFGGANFTSSSASDPRSVTLTNNANNFGPVSVSIGNNTGSISITEANTLNLRRVTMPGNGNATFTASSLNGDIMDSGFLGVLLGGNATATGSGVVTLTAVNGNIELNDSSSDIRTSSGLVFNANNVTLSVLGNASSSLVLGAASAPSQAAGNLTVTSLTGSISNAGAMTAGGTAFFQTPTGNIVIGQSGVGFGVLKFAGQQVSISESGNMDIATGSTATGAANLVSGGSISIVNVGGGNVTFASTVNLTATGNITPGNLLQSGGQLRVTHTGTADLSGLSLNSHLNGITPIDAGTGPYVAPAP